MKGWLTLIGVFIGFWILFQNPGFLTGGYPVFPQLMPAQARPYTAPAYDPTSDPCAQVPNPCSAQTGSSGTTSMGIASNTTDGMSGAVAAASNLLMGKIEQGAEGRIQAGTACSGDGDVSIDGNTYMSPYKNEEDPDWTGQLVIYHSDGFLRATYPVSCFPASQATRVGQDMLDNGCINNQGCRYVNIVKVGNQ